MNAGGKTTDSLATQNYTTGKAIAVVSDHASPLQVCKTCKQNEQDPKAGAWEMKGNK